jgi:hypothetical protein
MQTTELTTQNGLNIASITDAYIKLDQSLPVDRKLSWLQLCQAKAITMDALTKRELELQELLINYKSTCPTVDWETISVQDKQKVIDYLVTLQNALGAYNKGVKELPELRGGFTVYLDKIKKGLMVVEKRAEEWETFIEAKKFFFEIRAKKEEHDGKHALKDKELNDFVAHVKNEYLRLAMEYKLALSDFITKSYIAALEEQPNDDNLRMGVVLTWQSMQNPDVIPIGQPTKFEYKLNTKEEIIKAYQGVLPPDYAAILASAKNELNEKFSMYYQDKQNAAKAKEFILNEQTKAQVAVTDELQKSIAVNTLLSSASATVVQDNAGLKASVSKKVIAIQDDSPAWALKIASAFIGHWAVASAFLRIKKWGNLSVSQMAAALDEAGIKVADVEYVDKVK